MITGTFFDTKWMASFGECVCSYVYLRANGKAPTIDILTVSKQKRRSNWLVWNSEVININPFTIIYLIKYLIFIITVLLQLLDIWINRHSAGECSRLVDKYQLITDNFAPLAKSTVQCAMNIANWIFYLNLLYYLFKIVFFKLIGLLQFQF